MWTEADDHIREAGVGRAEILAPLGDDVGFVDHQQADVALAEFVQDLPVLQGFRGGDHDLGALVQLPEEFPALFGGLPAAETDAAYSGLFKPADLVVHQCEKRIDDDRDSPAKYGRKKEAQGFACTRGQNDDLVSDERTVFLFEDPVDYKNLIGFEGLDSEPGGCCRSDDGHVIFLHIFYNGKTAVFIRDSDPFSNIFPKNCFAFFFCVIIKSLVIQRKSGFRCLSGYGVGKGTDA